MPQYRLFIAYDGTDFSGWQKQKFEDGSPRRTIQGVVESAVRLVVREAVVLLGASRTDAGVHAKMQVASFVTKDPIHLPVDRLAAAISSRLPEDVVVWKAETIAINFDPIRDCVSKGYSYTIIHGIESASFRPIFNRKIVYWIEPRLDVDSMRKAASILVGKHDFASFTKLNHGRESTVRTEKNIEIVEVEDGMLSINISGDGFLWNMIRILAGTLVEVGRGRYDSSQIIKILNLKDRSAAGPTLPPQGLTLEWICYGEDIFE